MPGGKLARLAKLFAGSWRVAMTTGKTRVGKSDESSCFSGLEMG